MCGCPWCVPSFAVLQCWKSRPLRSTTNRPCLRSVFGIFADFLLFSRSNKQYHSNTSHYQALFATIKHYITPINQLVYVPIFLWRDGGTIWVAVGTTFGWYPLLINQEFINPAGWQCRPLLGHCWWMPWLDHNPYCNHDQRCSVDHQSEPYEIIGHSSTVAIIHQCSGISIFNLIINELPPLEP